MIQFLAMDLSLQFQLVRLPAESLDPFWGGQYSFFGYYVTSLTVTVPLYLMAIV